MQLGICFERAWSIFKQNAATFVIATLAIWGTNVVFAVLNRWLPGVSLVGSLIGGVLYGGLTIMALRARNGEPFDVPDIALGFQRPIPYVLVTLAVLAGLIACGVGVVVTAFLFMFSLIYVARGAEAGDALTRSKDLALANVGDVVVLLLVATVVNFIGLIPAGLGLLVTAPVTILAIIEAMEQLEGLSGAMHRA